MVKKKLKYFISVVLMVLISLAFIFSTVLRVSKRDVMKASAASVSSFAELKDALENGTDSEILILGDIDVECGIVDVMSGKGNMKTAEIVINRSVTIKSGEGGIKKLTRINKDGEKDGLRSMFEITGNDTKVTFKNIILDGGADFTNTTAYNRMYYVSGEIVKGRSLIDVCQNALLNVGENCTIRNCFADFSTSAHGYSTDVSCGGAIRTDFYSDDNVDMRGGSINLLSASTIENCSTRVKNVTDQSNLASYGGAVAVYDLGTVNVYGGATISGCSSANGGAIGLCHGPSEPYTTGWLNMDGGAISDCHALGGGAINVGENSSKDNIKFNLIATEQTSFSDCSSTEYGGNTIYVDNNNKVYLAPYYTKIEDETEVVVGNVSIQNCAGGDAYGSYTGQLPETLKGYTEHIQFKEYQENNTSTNESVITEGLESVKIKIEPENNATKYTAIIIINSSEDELQPEYKWYQSDDGTNWEEISGETNKEITISNDDEKAYYKVVVTSNTIPGEVSAQTKSLDDAIQSVAVTLTTSEETGKNTYSADITYKDPENEGESIVEPKYQWYEIEGEGTPTKIDGATDKTYTPESDDGSKTYKVIISSDYYKGTKEAQSEPSEIPPSEAVFKVGSEDSWEYYNNLSDAFLKVQEGGIYKNIIALKDYTLTSEAILYTPDINIDLQGHTISQTDSYKIRVRNTSGTVTIAGGTLIGNFDVAEEGLQNSAVYLNGIVKMENLTVTGNIYNDGHPLDCKNLSCEGLVINGAEGCKCSVDGLSVTSDDIRIYDDAEVDFYNINTSANIHINNDSIAKIHSGTMNCVYSEDNSKVDILGGNENVVYSHGDSEINISGGNMACVYSENNSSTNISGGVMDRVYVKDASNLKIFKEEGKDSYITNVHKDDSATGSVEISSGKFHENVKENNSLVEKYALKNIDETLNNVKYSFEVIYHPEHDHWIYSVENGGDTLKATCEIGDFDISIKLNSPENKTYNGEAISPAYFTQEEINAWSSAGITLPEITYEGTGETNYSSSTNPPVNAGTYLAKVSATGSDDVTKTVSVSFEIQKATSAAGDFAFTAPDNLVYDGNAKSATITAKSEVNGMGEVTVHYYSDEGRTQEISADDVKNVNNYYVGITVSEGDNYNEQNTVIYDDSWNFSVTKATPAPGDFTFSEPSDLVYDGNEKPATVTSSKEGIGTISVKYSTDGGSTWSDSVPKDAGTYLVGITTEGATNYENITTPITISAGDDKWEYSITKATPSASDFTFTAPDPLVYDGNEKPAIVTSSKEGIGTISVKYSTDGGNTWSDSVPKNAGTYLVGITTEGATNYENITTTPITVDTGDNKWEYSITKATPAPGDFTFSEPSDLVYDGNEKPATVTSSKEGIGTISIKYSTNGGSNWSDSVPKDVGTYLVGITTEGATNYENITTPITVDTGDNKWEYSITKATPSASDFTFTAPDPLVYDGNEKPAIVTSSKEGIGTISVKYSTDGGNTWSDSVPKDVGTYLVGVTTEGATNFENITTPLTVSAGDDKWEYSITKATPAPGDFTFTAPDPLVYDGNEKPAIVTSSKEGIGTISVKYSTDGGSTWSDSVPKDVGTYLVGVTTEGATNFDNITTPITISIGDGKWEYSITKATPSANDFTFTAPDPLVYDGNEKPAIVTSSKEGIGTISVKYSTDGGNSWSDSVPKDVGTYLVGITTEGATNYENITTPITISAGDDKWEYSITKATPLADHFSFTAPENLTYDGNTKFSTVTQKEGIVGMGEVVINYYSDKERTNPVGEPTSISTGSYTEVADDGQIIIHENNINVMAVKDAGTYYVGITVTDGQNYKETATNEVLSKDDWEFTINKATPAPGDFTFTAPDELVYNGTEKPATVTSNKEGIGTISVKYSTDGGNNWSDSVPKNSGTYLVGITTEGATNYENITTPLTVSTGDNKWEYSITKATPKLSDFAFTRPESLIYGEGDNSAKVYAAEGVNGMGNITVKYFSDAECTNEVERVFAGKYFVGITTAEGDNYNASAGVIHDSNWNFIMQAYPAGVDYIFSAPEDLVYNGENKTASVSAAQGVEGTGNITVHYFSDPNRSQEVSEVKNAGTYYVGITTTEGEYYLPTREGDVLFQIGWEFEIKKAEPILDFNIISGGTTGEEAQLQTENKEELFYGKTLENYKNILPESGVGNFSFKDESKEMKPVGDQYVDLVFTPNDTKNYDWTKVQGYNSETEKLDLKLLVSTVVDKSSWGDKVDNNGKENYVDNKDGSPNKGSTSVEITGDGIHWVKEESRDADTGEITSAWYGVDNSEGVFEKGSRFLVRWINRAENPDEWAKYHPMIDSKEVQNMPDKKKWIFIAEVIHPDGTHKYEKLDQPVPLYIQLGDDWDVDDVEAYFLSQGNDERLSKQYMGDMDCPEGKKKFFKLELLHFSPYTIYDVDPVSSNNDSSVNVNPKEDNNSSIVPNDNSDDDYYTEDEYSENEEPKEDNSKNKINENEEGGKSTPAQEENKGGINPWYIAAGIGLLGLSLLLGWLLYKKRKKEKEILMYSILAQVGKSSASA